MTRKKVVKKKLEIVFDANKRKEFLTGFQKRKNERRKRAREELERNIKNERLKIRQEIKEGISHLKKTFEPLRELTEEDKKEDEYEDDDVKVKIVELSTGAMAAANNMLGENQAEESEEETDNNEESDDDSIMNDPNCIPGMDFDVTARIKKKHAESAGNENDDQSQEKKPKFRKYDLTQVKSKKDLDRFKKNKTLNKLKQSKVFKLKERFDKQANKKKVKRDRNNMLRSIPKNQRKNLKVEPCKYRKGRLLNRKELRKKRKQQ